MLVFFLGFPIVWIFEFGEVVLWVVGRPEKLDVFHGCVLSVYAFTGLQWSHVGLLVGAIIVALAILCCVYSFIARENRSTTTNTFIFVSILCSLSSATCTQTDSAPCKRSVRLYVGTTGTSTSTC